MRGSMAKGSIEGTLKRERPERSFPSGLRARWCALSASTHSTRPAFCWQEAKACLWGCCRKLFGPTPSPFPSSPSNHRQKASPVDMVQLKNDFRLGMGCAVCEQ